MNSKDLEDWSDINYKIIGVSNFSKYGKPDTVCRPGRLNRGELRYRGNSSMAPRKDHKGKGLTLRDHRGAKV